jgi:SAM-dependent methyltransferase
MTETDANGPDARVRAQYDQHPYPARDPKDEAKRLVEGSPSHLLEIRHYLFAGGARMPKPLRVLVAGGGTGDATIMLAQQLADAGLPAEIVYLDLSAASRAICEARAAARGLETIRFVSGAIEDLPSLAPGPFDYIDCCGVLHHLGDPAGGLAILESLLAPGGGMGIMVYGAIGRRGVYDTQAMLRALGEDEPDATRLDLARQLLKQFPATNWLRKNPAIRDHLAAGDAGLYDLLLHARDRAFSVPELADLVAGSGLSVVSLIEPWRYQPKRYLTDPQLLKRLDALAPLARAAFAEQLVGNIKVHIAYLVRSGETAGRIASPDDGSLVPMLKGLDGASLARGLKPGAGITIESDGVSVRLPLPARAGPILALVDGTRTIDAIVGAIAGGGDTTKARADFAATYETFNDLNRLFLKEPGL